MSEKAAAPTAAQPSAQEIIAQQKANCPFCKIVTGEIPAFKVFEDDKMMAIADINPIAKGHILAMPKEHYPILPFIPEDVFRHFFETIKYISKGVKDSVVVDSTNIFIANGAAAGQQSPHFLVHIIPRERGDNIDAFVQKKADLDPTQLAQFTAVLKANIGPFLAKVAKKSEPAPSPAAPAEEKPKVSEEQKKLLATAIEQNPDIKHLLLTDVAAFEKKIAADPKLVELFKGVDVKVLSERLKKVYDE